MSVLCVFVFFCMRLDMNAPSRTPHMIQRIKERSSRKLMHYSILEGSRDGLVALLVFVHPAIRFHQHGDVGTGMIPSQNRPTN